jgi:long-chain acyl-CoA synthetase
VIDPELPRYTSIVQAFRASVASYPDTTALVCGERRLSYADLGRAVSGLSRRLRELCIEGGRVAIVMPTSIEAVVAVLAVLSAGAQAALINPFFTPAELEVVLGEAEPSVAVCGPEASSKLHALGARCGLANILSFGEGDGGLQLDRWLVPTEPNALDVAEPAPDARALLIFTGGTTGEPKAVEHSHRALFVSVLQHCSVWPVARGKERFLSAAPIFHVWGLAYSTFVPLYSGGTLVIIPKFDPEQVLYALEAEKITIFAGGPAPVYLALSHSSRYAATNFSSLKYSLSGGAPCPEELCRYWQEHTGAPLLEGWGMSEAAPLCLNPPGASKQLSVGRAVPETQVQVVDLETGTRVLAAGQPGEVRVRGPQLMLGYRSRSAATQEVLRDGWLYTGDIGYLDADAHLFLVDRKKDMIIVGGYNVYPRQVDEVLFKHPKIAEVATIGRADARLGEVLVAFVVPKVNVALSEQEFFEYCRDNLVKYRRPVAVSFLASLPRTNARKIDKQALRALLAIPGPAE